MIIKPDYILYDKTEPVLSKQEIENVFVMLFNFFAPDLINEMSYFVDFFNNYIKLKQGVLNEKVVLTGDRFFEYVLQENLKSGSFRSNAKVFAIYSQESQEIRFV